MTPEELQAAVAGAFPKVEKAAVQVKDYLTLRLPAVSDLVPVALWLRDGKGFDYLDMVSGSDFSGPVDGKGYVMDPNPNRFIPEGATEQVESPARTPNFPYRDAIELIYCFSNLRERLKVFVKLDVPRSDARAPSLAPLFKTADWQEREVLDLLGVAFDGHPNPTRILTPEFIQGHPLRKDYAHVKDRFD